MRPRQNKRLKKKIKVEVHHGILKALIGIAFFIGFIVLFAFIADEAVLEKENGFDQLVSDFLKPFSSPVLITYMVNISFFGSSTFLFPAYVVLTLYFLVRKKIKHAMDIAIISLSGMALEFALKLLFHRDRPDMPLIQKLSTYSFPSGHAMSSVIFCGLLIHLIWENEKMSNNIKWIISIVLAFIALSIGISRIVLRVHYATDIVAGISLAVAWVILCRWVLRHIYLGFSKTS